MLRLNYSRSMVSCAVGDEELGFLIFSPERKEALGVLECLCGELAERAFIPLPLFWTEKFEVNGMSRIRIRPV